MIYVRRPMTDTTHVVSPDDPGETECGLLVHPTEPTTDVVDGRECVICKTIAQVREIGEMAHRINESLAEILATARG